MRIEPNQWTFVLAKLYFHYASMNAGKSTLLLQASYNYEERGMRTLLLTAALDDRAGHGRIASRIGLGSDALTFTEADDLYGVVEREIEQESAGRLACVFVDEAQFLSEAQVWQLARVVDRLNVPVMTYGLRTDFRGELFPGSKALLAIADSLREIRTICFCGKKATMVVRVDAEGKALSEGAQIDVGGNDKYVPYCREHWMEKTGRRPDRG
ncbi:thymidine kinase [Rhizobium albus]|nr:thymidine kinase [Rhizobium albus]